MYCCACRSPKGVSDLVALDVKLLLVARRFTGIRCSNAPIKFGLSPGAHTQPSHLLDSFTMCMLCGCLSTVFWLQRGMCAVQLTWFAVVVILQTDSTCYVVPRMAAPPFGTSPQLHPPLCPTWPSAMRPSTAWPGAAPSRQWQSAASATMHPYVCWAMQRRSRRFR